MTTFHDHNCGWNFGHDCTCGYAESSSATPRPAPPTSNNVREAVEIRGIHTNRRHPGLVYASVYVDGKLNFSATLDLCYKRAEEKALAALSDKGGV